MSAPFQDLVEAVAILVEKGDVHKAIWTIREYDLRRRRIRPRKAILTEHSRCLRYAGLFGKTRVPNPEVEAYLRGAADAMYWALLPTPHRAAPPHCMAHVGSAMSRVQEERR